MSRAKGQRHQGKTENLKSQKSKNKHFRLRAAEAYMHHPAGGPEVAGRQIEQHGWRKCR
jgi:hypothetical protein